MGVAALAATLLVWGLTVNRLVKRKLKLSIFLLIGYVALHVVFVVRPELGGTVATDARIADPPVRAAGADRRGHQPAGHRPDQPAAVGSRPRPVSRRSSRTRIVIGMLLIVATFVFKEQLLTTSAVGAVVVGFALQDTLGQRFAGLAIQSERPFKVGHWIRVGEFEGRVAEITWRATKLRTKTGNFIVVPNNIIGKEAITNYSEPAVPTRLELEVGVSYDASPAAVKQAMHEAMAQARYVLTSPAPDVLLVGFDASSINYRASFWVDDYELDEEATRRGAGGDSLRLCAARHRDSLSDPGRVLARLAGARRGGARSRTRAGDRRRRSLRDAVRRSSAPRSRGATVTQTFGNGEAIVRQGEPGDSMYVLCSGPVAVVLEPDRQEVATIRSGGYFGEMSLLTGEPRSATVVARGEAVVLELTAEVFRRLGDREPARARAGRTRGDHPARGARPREVGRAGRPSPKPPRRSLRG